MKFKLGIFGGSFNPIHNGHMMVAFTCMKFCNLDEVIFVPCKERPLLKKNLIASKYRLAMIKKAIKWFPGLTVNDVELKRRGISYTYDTIMGIRVAEMHPDKQNEFFLIISSDLVLEFKKWKKAKEILNYVKLVIFCRKKEHKIPNKIFGKPIIKVPLTLFKKKKLILPEVVKERTKLSNISSTKIRKMLKNSKRNDEKLEHFLGPDVYKYIKKNKLYGVKN